ncbi:MAG: flagellar biosynthetic protein FliR [Planctomycetota bacterium]|jgi:flagellar biosynthetic protein FliR
MDYVIQELLGFMMVSTRLSGFFLVAPVFSWKSIPPLIKISMIVILSIFICMVHPVSASVVNAKVLESILLLINELSYGLALGLICSLLFGAVKFAGRIIERQMGLAMASVVDPLTGENTQAVSMLLEMIFILLFLSANGHHFFLQIMARSYEAFPAGTVPTIPIMCEGIVQAGTSMLTAGLRISAPLLAVFLILMVILAVMARIAPEMNILFISFPIKIGIGLIILAMFMPFINSYISEYADWLGKLLPL